MDYDATVKRIALVLKKRDPATFMTVCNEWDSCKDTSKAEDALGALEAFLSNIVHVCREQETRSFHVGCDEEGRGVQYVPEGK